MPGKWWTPTRKWWTARVTAVTGLATMWATTGSWDQEETLMAITVVSAALLAWRVPNEEAPTRDDLKAKIERNN